MRYRLRTLLVLVAFAGIVLAWWLDHARLSLRLGLRERQIRQLQRQVDERLGVLFASNLRFKTPEELIEFVKTATEEEFDREEWSAFGNSHVAEQAIGPLTELLHSPSGVTRHHAAWLLGVIGRKRRPPTVNPIPALLKIIDDPSSRVRAEAIYAVGAYGSLARSALPALRQIMQRDHSHNAYLATLAVKEIDPAEDIGPRLRDLFLFGDRWVQINVASSLPDHLPPAEAKRILLEQNDREADPEMQEVLAQALNKIK
jgi:HEAT repeat protein